eukprot:jgi/Tetstr1/422697/TSEL_013495.t1
MRRVCDNRPRQGHRGAGPSTRRNFPQPGPGPGHGVDALTPPLPSTVEPAEAGLTRRPGHELYEYLGAEAPASEAAPRPPPQPLAPATAAGCAVALPPQPPMGWAVIHPMQVAHATQPPSVALVQPSGPSAAQHHAWMSQHRPPPALLEPASLPQQLVAAQLQEQQAAAQAYSRQFYHAQMFRQQQQQYAEAAWMQRMEAEAWGETRGQSGTAPPSASNLSRSGSCGSCGGSSSSAPECGESPSAQGEGEGEVADVGHSAEVGGPPVDMMPKHNPHGNPRPEWRPAVVEGQGEVGYRSAGSDERGLCRVQRGSQTEHMASRPGDGYKRQAACLAAPVQQSECVSATMSGHPACDAEPQEADAAASPPIMALSEDLLMAIFQMLSTSEWRTVVPAICKRWKSIVDNCDDLWGNVEVCPFENSAVARRLRSRPERFWAMNDRPDAWLASSSLSAEKILSGLRPHMGAIHTLLLSCLALNLTPASYDGHPIASGDGGGASGDSGPAGLSQVGRPVRIRSTDMSSERLIWLLSQVRPSLRQLVLRVSGDITTGEVIHQACAAPNLELLHADLGNVELDCSMLAPLKHLRSLRLKRDELSLDVNEGSIKLVNLHRLEECTRLTRLSLGFDTHLKQLAPELFNLDKLTMLEVDRCGNMERLPPAVSKLTNLQTLSLTGSSSLTELPPEIKSLAQLVSLNLSFCTRMGALPKEIGWLSNLQHMNMEGGYAMFDDSVPCEIGFCCNLQSLVLSDTHILSLPRLAVKLAACLNLQILALDHNDDLQVEEYPHEIMNLPKLTTLSIRKYERQSWSVLSTRNIARMQEEATHLRLSRTRNLNIIL